MEKIACNTYQLFVFFSFSTIHLKNRINYWFLSSFQSIEWFIDGNIICHFSINFKIDIVFLVQFFPTHCTGCDFQSYCLDYKLIYRKGKTCYSNKTIQYQYSYSIDFINFNWLCLCFFLYFYCFCQVI